MRDASSIDQLCHSFLLPAMVPPDRRGETITDFLRFDIVGEEDALIFHVHREVRSDIQAYKETECQRHAPVYTGVHDS